VGRRIEVLDTTLRDGAQGEGVSFSVEDRIKIARALDKLGVDYIEAGNPAASRRDAEAFAFFAAHPLTEGAELVAFGSTCHAYIKAGDDDGFVFSEAKERGKREKG
jgi:2-isopropylmalate synthase